MIFLKSPGEIPKHINYKILKYNGLEKQVMSLLSIVEPESRFSGFIDSLKSFDSNSEYLIIVSPNYPKIISNIDNKDKVIIFIPQIGDTWGFWETSKNLLEKLKRNNSRIEISQDQWLSVLESLGRISKIRKGFSTHGWRWLFMFFGLRFGRRMVNNIPSKFPVLEKDLWIYEDYRLFEGGVLNPKWLDKKSLNKIQVVSNKLSDKKSKDIYLSLFSGNPVLLWKNYLSRILNSIQYFEYTNITKGDIIINGGVFYGSEIPVFLAMTEGKGEIHCLDPLGFDFLSEYTQENIKNFSGAVKESRFAISDISDEVLTLNHAHQVQTVEKNIITENDKSFHCKTITILDYIQRHKLQKVDLVKLDLEGAEELAIKTLPEVIRRFRPQLAISVYHKPEHLWEMSLEIMQMCKDYHFYLNSYSTERYEVILYCIPIEKDKNKITHYQKKSLNKGEIHIKL